MLEFVRKTWGRSISPGLASVQNFRVKLVILGPRAVLENLATKNRHSEKKKTKLVSSKVRLAGASKLPFLKPFHVKDPRGLSDVVRLEVLQLHIWPWGGSRWSYYSSCVRLRRLGGYRFCLRPSKYFSNVFLLGIRLGPPISDNTYWMDGVRVMW